MTRTLATLALTIAAIMSPLAIATAQPETITVELPRCSEEDCSDLQGTDTGVWVDPDTGEQWVVVVD